MAKHAPARAAVVLAQQQRKGHAASRAVLDGRAVVPHKPEGATAVALLEGRRIAGGVGVTGLALAFLERLGDVTDVQGFAAGCVHDYFFLLFLFCCCSSVLLYRYIALDLSLRCCNLNTNLQ